MAGFAQATAVEAVGDGRFAVTLDDEWTVGERPNGGYLVAVLARAALAAHPVQTHVLAASTHFSGAPVCGPAEVATEVLRAGRFASQVRTTLWQDGRALVHTLCTLGTLTTGAEPRYAAPAPGDDTSAPGDDTSAPGDDTSAPGDDTSAPGGDAAPAHPVPPAHAAPAHPASAHAAPAPAHPAPAHPAPAPAHAAPAPAHAAPARAAPPPLADCVRLPVRRSEKLPMRLWDVVELHADPTTLGWAERAPSGRPEARAWLVPPEPVDPLLLLVALDCLPAVTLELGSRGWVPTLELTTYLRALPKPGPLWVQQRALLVQDGLVDETCLVHDAAGRLVAHGSQLAAVRF